MVYQDNVANTGPVSTVRPGFVLVVDDEPFFAGAATEMLLHAGYLATFALDAKAALREIETNPDIDLLLTDVVMPGGVSGLDLARDARRLRQDLKIVVVSGYLRGDSRASEVSGLAFLEKPFLPAELTDTVATVLAAAPRR